MSTGIPESQPADLPSPPGAIRRALREHPRETDWAIVIVFVLLTIALTVLSFLTSQDGGTTFTWAVPDYLHSPKLVFLIAGVLVTFAALLTRRTHPMASLISVLVASIAVPEDLAPSGTITLAIAVLLYTVPAYSTIRNSWIGYLLTVFALILTTATTALFNNSYVFDIGTLSGTATLALLMLVPVTLGINTANRRRYTEAIIDRAHQLARERDQLARLAVAEERTRIAREMHDIIAHSVSVMVTLSEGAARAVEIHPEAAVEAMRQSAETGRTALTEMRQLIGALREPSDDTGRDSGAATMAPMPGIDDLPELIRGFNAAGLSVELAFSGRTPEHTATGEQGRDLAIYRTVQEALTNTLRYAGEGSRVRVVIEDGSSGTTLRIHDDGGEPHRDRPMTGLGSGQGLVGLAERLRVYGGQLEYGPEGTGWSVVATLPADSPGEEL